MDTRPKGIDWDAVFAEHRGKKDSEIGRAVGCTRQAVGHARRACASRPSTLEQVKRKLEELRRLVEAL